MSRSLAILALLTAVLVIEVTGDQPVTLRQQRIVRRPQGFNDGPPRGHPGPNFPGPRGPQQNPPGQLYRPKPVPPPPYRASPRPPPPSNVKKPFFVPPSRVKINQGPAPRPSSEKSPNVEYGFTPIVAPLQGLSTSETNQQATVQQVTKNNEEEKKLYINVQPSSVYQTANQQHKGDKHDQRFSQQKQNGEHFSRPQFNEQKQNGEQFSRPQFNEQKQNGEQFSRPQFNQQKQNGEQFSRPQFNEQKHFQQQESFQKQIHGDHFSRPQFDEQRVPNFPPNFQKPNGDNFPPRQQFNDQRGTPSFQVQESFHKQGGEHFLRPHFNEPNVPIISQGPFQNQQIPVSNNGKVHAQSSQYFVQDHRIPSGTFQETKTSEIIPSIQYHIQGTKISGPNFQGQQFQNPQFTTGQQFQIQHQQPPQFQESKVSLGVIPSGQFNIPQHFQNPPFTQKGIPDQISIPVGTSLPFPTANLSPNYPPNKIQGQVFPAEVTQQQALQQYLSQQYISSAGVPPFASFPQSPNSPQVPPLYQQPQGLAVQQSLTKEEQDASASHSSPRKVAPLPRANSTVAAPSKPKKTTLKDILAEDCTGAEEFGYCASPPRYPTHQVTSILKKCSDQIDDLFDEDAEAAAQNSAPKHHITERANNEPWSWAAYQDAPEDSCVSTAAIVEPGYARDAGHGRWLVVLQHSTSDLHQRVAVDVCAHEGGPCGCVQHYESRSLVAWDPDHPTKCPAKRTFSFPTKCVCPGEQRNADDQ